jgi:CHAD domain-containing protein
MTGGSIVVEREMKFDVDSAFEAPDLRRVVGNTFRIPEQQLRTTYFDTADLRLWSQDVTLCHHKVVSEGDLPLDEGPGMWTLHGGGSEVSWSGPVDRVPERAERIVVGLVRREPLREVAQMETTRKRLLLQDADAKRPWAEIDDDLVTVTAGLDRGRRFRQMELELSAAASAFQVATEAVMRELRSAGAEPTERSMLAIALGLTSRSEVTEREATTVREFVQQTIRADLDRLLSQDLRLRLADDSKPIPSAVHDARVATRRLRSDLRAMRSLLDPVWVGHVRDDLEWVGAALGQLRDLDVLADCLRELTEPPDIEDVEPLLHLADAERRAAAHELSAILEQPRYIDMLDRLRAATDMPPLVGPGDQSAAEVVGRLVRSEYRALERNAARLDRDPADQELHRLRIHAKRLRYVAEAGQGILGKPARRTAKRAQALQTVLGELQDLSIAAVWLTQQATHPSITPATAFRAGQISCLAERRAAEVRASWVGDFRRLSARKVAKHWSG